jgi:hypothetical protein
MHKNIEKSGFQRGLYIGFTATKGTQRIKKNCCGEWVTCGLASADGTAIFRAAKTLKKLGEILENC